jgi:gluconate 5-dehydrogenase
MPQNPPPSPFDLQGRVALVTGGGRGLGFEMARSLAGAGAIVHINGRDAEALEAAAGRLRTEDLDVRANAFDVGDERGALAAIEGIRNDHGRLDILVNNVGARLRRPATGISVQEFAELLNVDLVASFVLSRAAAQLMIEGGYGRIIMVTSTTALLAAAADAAYTAAKGGLAALTRSLACEYGTHGITCNALCPGTFATETNAEAARNPVAAAWLAGRTPLGRWGRPEEIGGACLFLASPAASYVTGATLVVDGGLTASAGSVQAPP